MRYLPILILLALLCCPAQAAGKEARSDSVATTGGFEGPVSGAEAQTVVK